MLHPGPVPALGEATSIGVVHQVDRIEDGAHQLPDVQLPDAQRVGAGEAGLVPIHNAGHRDAHSQQLLPGYPRFVQKRLDGPGKLVSVLQIGPEGALDHPEAHLPHLQVQGH